MIQPARAQGVLDNVPHLPMARSVDDIEPPPPLIVGLGGTARRDSSTERALRIALARCEEQGAEILCFGAGELHLPMYAPERAERTADAGRLVAGLRAADGIIVATPGYHGGISGLVKNALDYAEDLRDDERPYFDGRAVGCIVCAYGWQATTTTLASLRAVVHALRGWPTPLGVTINSAQPIWDDSGALTDDRVRESLNMLSSQVLEFARSRAL